MISEPLNPMVCAIWKYDDSPLLQLLFQEPVVFSGTIRENLDPYGNHNDVEIWHSLEHAHLKDFVSQFHLGLEFECGEDGSNMRLVFLWCINYTFVEMILHTVPVISPLEVPFMSNCFQQGVSERVPLHEYTCALYSFHVCIETKYAKIAWLRVCIVVNILRPTGAKNAPVNSAIIDSDTA